MTDSTNATVESPEELSAVEQARADLDAKRRELDNLTAENTASDSEREDAITLRKIQEESERLEVELSFQRRLKNAREAQSTSQSVPADPGFVTPAVTPVSTPEAPSAPVAPEDNTNTEASAKVSGKGK